MANKEDAVLVVGAGLAGLYAARLLRRAGLGVTVLEARDRVGGRVLSRRLADGSSVDLGAQWIGPGQRRMYALAREFGLKTTATHDRGDVVIEWNGRLRRMPDTTPPLSWVARLDALRLGWMVDRIAKKLPVTEPWSHPRAVRLDGVSFAGWLKESSFSEEAATYWRREVEAGMCASADDFSPLELAHQVATAGSLARLEAADDHAFFEAGAQTIAERLADEVGEDLRLRAPVQELRLEDGVVRAVTDRGDFRGRRVILALPPQLVGKIAFEGFPGRRPAAGGEKPVLGSVVKSVVVYDRAWWRAAGLSGAAASGGSVNYLVDTSNAAGRPGILVALAAGPQAAVLFGADEQTRREAVLAHVRRMLGEPPARPREFFSMDWTSEPWSLGGYASSRAIGGWTGRKETLAEPRSPVHFAGTETATGWRGYMEGALQSAERASAEVIDALGR